jgi:glycosyltransferase involved in cell wall biosynthesis
MTNLNPHEYTKDLFNQKVLLIGIFPPPLGGISIHLRRVCQKLALQSCIVWNWDVCKEQLGRSRFGYYWHLWLFCWRKKPQVIIYHTMQLRIWPLELGLLLLVSKLMRAKTIAVIHSARFAAGLSFFSAKMTNFLLKFYGKIILVSTQLQRELAFKIKFSNNIFFESPFLLPDLTQKNQILAEMPVKLNQFCSSHQPIITIAITRKQIWQGGDLYGTDLALLALDKLKLIYPKVGLMLSIADGNGFEDLKSSKNCYVLLEWQYEIWPLIAQSDLFIRPTRSDSYGISVMEALAFGTPVIASDVCPRPKGTILFKNGDFDDLYLKMVQVLAEKSFLPHKLLENKKNKRC